MAEEASSGRPRGTLSLRPGSPAIRRRTCLAAGCLLLAVALFALMEAKGLLGARPAGRLPASAAADSPNRSPALNVRCTPSDASGSAPPQSGCPGAAAAAAWVSAYEQYDAARRCSRLARADAAEQRFVRSFVSSASVPLSCYRDHCIGRAPCDEIRTLFRLPRDAAAAEEELAFPLAFGVRVHACATQVELLLSAIYEPHNFYCLHVDGRSPPEFVSAMRRLTECLPNVNMAPLDMDFVYASPSQMDADLECMQLASQSSVRWRYFINLAGQELPLKTNYELVQMLSSLNGSSHVYIEKPANPERQAHSFWCQDASTNRTVACRRPLKAKRPAPRNLIIYKSYANAEFSRAFVEYLLDEGGFAKQLYDWFSDTYAPEEHYYATLLALPDTPGGVWRQSPTRAILWYGDGECGGRFVRAICIFVSADLPRLVAGRPEPFVNKLHFEDDPIAVRCLVEIVLARQKVQRANSTTHLSRHLGAATAFAARGVAA